MAGGLFGQSQLVAPADRSATANQQSRFAMLRVLSNKQLSEIEDQTRKAEEQHSNDPMLSGMARVIEDQWTTNRKHKETSGIETEMLDNLRQCNSEYGESAIQQIREQGGSEVFMGLTGVKCRAAESWIKDVMTAERPWKLVPSPDPALPPDVTEIIAERAMQEVAIAFQQAGQVPDPGSVFEFASRLRDEVEQDIREQAELRADRMSTKVHDQLVEGNWRQAFDEVLSDIVRMKGGILKGPVVRRKRRLQWTRNATGRTMPAAQWVLRHEYERVSPFDFYPSPGAKGTDPEDGNTIERIRFPLQSLEAMLDVPGYDASAIKAIMAEYETGRFTTIVALDQTRATLEGKGSRGDEMKDAVEALEFWGCVLGRILIEQGVFSDPAGKPVNPQALYEINAIKVGPYIMYRNFNPDPLGRRPYSKTVWERMAGSFWGKGVPDLMRDLQKICNGAMRSLCNNMGVASGFQAFINDINRLPHGEKIDTWFAQRIWQFINPTNSSVPPIGFFQPDSNAQELLGVYDRIARIADDYTGIPAYAYGSDQVAGAGRTASGLSMLMNSSARGIKRVVARIDEEMIRPVVRRQVDWNMQYDTDETCKGDVEIQPVGALAQILKEQILARRQEFLQASANPLDQAIIGPEERAYVWREQAKSLDLPPDKVVKSERGIQQMKEAQAAEAMAAQQMEQQRQAEAGGSGRGPGAARSAKKT